MKNTPKILIEIEEPSGITRESWPVSTGIPFQKGMVTDSRQIILRDQNNQQIPIQVKPLLFWRDGSIKWMLIHFQTTLEAQNKHIFSIQIEKSVKSIQLREKVKIDKTGGQFTFDTGSLQFIVDTTQGFSLINEVLLHQKFHFDNNQSKGFVLINVDGEEFSSINGKVTYAEIEENGPLRAVLRIKGDHCNQVGTKLFQYEARLTAYAGHPWLEFEYTFINDCNDDYTDLKQISFEIFPEQTESTVGLVGAYNLLHEDTKPFSIYQDKPCRYFFFNGTRIYDENNQHIEYQYAGEMLRKAAHGWMDISSSNGGITVFVKRLALMAPKAIYYTGHSVDVQLWPKCAGLLRFHQGMARTHKVIFNFHEGEGRESEVNKLCTCFEDDAVISIPNWIIDSGVWREVFSYNPQKYPEINIRLRDQFNSFYMGNFSLGFLDYGDSLQHGGGDRSNYAANNEYDMPQVMALMFARTGEREYFEVMEASAWHMMDIDFIHHTTHAPQELGGVRIHGNQHVQYNCEGMPDYSLATSHMWTEGLLAYFSLTGHPAALEKAISIGNCLLNLLADGWAIPPYKIEWHSVRDSAWPLIALSALYEATGDEKWLAAIKRIAEAVMNLQNPDGSWDLYIGWCNGRFAPLQIGIALSGLARYHQITGDPRALNSMILGANALIERCSFPEGVLCYINAPGYRWNYYATCIIEALGYIWGQTNNSGILALGERSLYRSLSSMEGNGTTLAESWRGMLRYMYWAEKAGNLKDIQPW